MSLHCINLRVENTSESDNTCYDKPQLTTGEAVEETNWTQTNKHHWCQRDEGEL